MRRRLLLVLTLIAVASASLIIAAASFSGGAAVGDPVGDPPGPPLALSASERGLLGRFAKGEMALTGKAFLLRAHGPKAIYQLEKADGGACYSAGRVAPAFKFGRFGAIACSQYFPYRDALLDFSTVTIDKGADVEEARFVDVQGVASDSVTAVRALDENGAVLAEDAVTNNVYWIDLPEGQVAVKVVALDAQGKTVETVPR